MIYVTVTGPCQTDGHWPMAMAAAGSMDRRSHAC